MVDNEALVKQFESVRAKYQELMKRLVQARVPATLEPSAAACDVGEWCCTGTERVRNKMEEVILPAAQIGTRR